MAKKINCKHGLDRRQEIEARRLSQKLGQGDEETLKLYRDMLMEYAKESSGTYLEYIKLKNPVYYSALIRQMGREDPQGVLQKIWNN